MFIRFVLKAKKHKLSQKTKLENKQKLQVNILKVTSVKAVRCYNGDNMAC